tara:strand:+ start:520 stop:951 length:432 start_codon:yes stop_codon:yes gene_type:complete
MPSKSAKQQKFMTAVANNPKFAKEVGVPQSVGRKFDMPYGPGTYGSKVGRPPKKYRGGGGMGRSMMAAPEPALDSRLEGAIISPPLDPRGGLERDLRDISDLVGKPKKKKKKKKKMNAGGKVRGAGKASQGVRKCKYVSMKGS